MDSACKDITSWQLQSRWNSVVFVSCLLIGLLLVDMTGDDNNVSAAGAICFFASTVFLALFLWFLDLNLSTSQEKDEKIVSVSNPVFLYDSDPKAAAANDL